MQKLITKLSNRSSASSLDKGEPKATAVA